MRLTPEAKEFFDGHLKRHGYLSPHVKMHLYAGVKDGSITSSALGRLGNLLKERMPAKEDERYKQHLDILLALQYDALRNKKTPANALEYLTTHFDRLTKDNYVLSREEARGLVAGLVRTGRAKEVGDYNISRGIDEYSKWAGVNLIEEARALVKRHGAIVALDVGGGRGKALADLKQKLGDGVREAHVTSLKPHYPLLPRETPPFEPKYSPTMHVAHNENLPLGSGTTHLVVSVRGGTRYASSRLPQAVREIVRTMRPGAKAFLQIDEPTINMEKRLENLFKKEGITARYKYGLVVKDKKDRSDGELHIRDDIAARERVFDRERHRQSIGKYRVLCLEKR